jgi:thiamine biosynthesis lipoprotein ApbE
MRNVLARSGGAFGIAVSTAVKWWQHWHETGGTRQSRAEEHIPVGGTQDIDIGDSQRTAGFQLRGTARSVTQAAHSCPNISGIQDMFPSDRNPL